MMAKYKTCQRCGYEKKLGDFGPRRCTRDQKHPWCRECVNAGKRAWYHSFPPVNARHKETI